MAPIKTRTQNYVFWLGLIPLLLATASWHISSQYSECLNGVSNARDILDRIDNLLSGLTAAETGQRGYILTGKDVYLEPFLATERSLESKLHELSPKLLAEANDPEIINRLNSLVQDKLDELRATIKIRQTAGFQPALNLIDTDRGQKTMMNVRQLVAMLQSHERALLAGRQEILRQLRIQVISLFVAGVLASFLLVALVYRANRRFVFEQEEKQAELNQANAELEERVHERTFQLEQRTTELERRTQELQRSNADLESFAFIASHDLQEPLRMISAFGALLSRQYHQKLDPRADEFIEFMVNSAQRMQLLIDDLLQYARIGRQAFDYEQMALADSVHIACVQLSTVVKEANAEIEIDDLPLIWGSKLLLAQVFEELIGNAVKFRNREQIPKIIISTTKSQNTSVWTITVQDNGIGFDPQYREVIFRMFQTLHPKADYPGTGVGLAICKRIIEQHGGQLWAESSPGAGSTFCFTFPKFN